jgi:hypothetical protein
MPAVAMVRIDVGTYSNMEHRPRLVCSCGSWTLIAATASFLTPSNSLIERHDPSQGTTPFACSRANAAGVRPSWKRKRREK